MTATVSLAAVMLILSNTAWLGSAVVCVGFDGHVDVESLFEGCCNPDTPDSPSSDKGFVPADPNCGDCTDVELKASSLRSRECQLSHPDLGTGCPVGKQSLGGKRSVRSEVVVGMDQHWHSLVTISSVVLLT